MGESIILIVVGIFILVGIWISFMVFDCEFKSREFWNMFLKISLSIVMGAVSGLIVSGLFFAGIWTNFSERVDIYIEVPIEHIFKDNDEYFAKVEDSVSVEYRLLRDADIVVSDVNRVEQIKSVLVDSVYWGFTDSQVNSTVIKIDSQDRIKTLKR